MNTRQLFRKGANPYYILAPGYAERSAGIRAMHYLCHALNLSGLEAYMLCNGPEAMHLKAPLINREVVEYHESQGLLPIYIYPESVSGNPYNARMSARFLLNHPGLIGGDLRYPKDVQVFYFSKDFLNADLSANNPCHPLIIPVFDTSLFYPPAEPVPQRERAYLYLNRFPLAEVDFSALPADIEVLPNDKAQHQLLGEVFRSARALYSYERSAICGEAILCGCPVVLLPGRLLTERPDQDNYGRYGIAWGTAPEELEFARQTLGLYQQGYRQVEQEFWQDFDRFVELTQARAQLLQGQEAVPINTEVDIPSVALPAERVQALALQQEAPPPAFTLICHVEDAQREQQLRECFDALMPRGNWEFCPIQGAKTLGAAFNQGAAQAGAEVLVFLGVDWDFYAEDLARQLRQYLQPKQIIGAMGVERLLNPDWRQNGYPLSHGKFAYVEGDGYQVEIHSSRSNSVADLAALGGGLLIMQRGDWQTLRFDEERFGFSDLCLLDLSYRASRAQFSVQLFNDFLLIKRHAPAALAEAYAQEFVSKHGLAVKASPVAEPARVRLDDWDDLLRFQKNEVVLNRIGTLRPPGAVFRKKADTTDIDQRVEKAEQQARAYDTWKAKMSIQEIDAEILAERMVKQWSSRPTFTLLMVVTAGDEAALTRTVSSMQQQLYGHWRLIVISDVPSFHPAFDGSETLGWLQLNTVADAALLVVAANNVLTNIGGDWAAWLPVGTALEPHALVCVADYGVLHAEWAAIYSDDDRISADGAYSSPRFKPGFNLDLLRCQDYIGPGVFVRGTALKAVGGWLPYVGVEHYDLLWRLGDQGLAIGHIDYPLVHLPYTWFERDRLRPLSAALSAHFQRQQLKVEITPTRVDGVMRVMYPLRRTPWVSVVMPVRNGYGWLKDCLQGLFENTKYAELDVVIVDNDSDDPDVLTLYETYRARYTGRFQVVYYREAFNFSAMCNRGAERANGEFLLLLNSDMVVVQPDWLEKMLRHALREEIGVVGAKLVYPEVGRMQHGGIILGSGPTGAGVIRGFELDEGGYMQRMECDQNVSAVTGACLMVATALYRALDGFDEVKFPILNGDADFCLRVAQTGRYVVWTPSAVLVHLEGQTILEERRGFERLAQWSAMETQQFATMTQRWGSVIAADPAYNRHLSLQVDRAFDIETEFLGEWDVNFRSRPRILGVQPSGGVGEYRFFQPVRALMRAGRVQHTLIQSELYNKSRYLTVTDLMRLDADVLMRQAWTESFDVSWQELYRQHLPKLRLVVMMDDLLDKLPELHPAYKKVPRDARYRLRKLFGLSDALIVSTPVLAHWAKDMIDEIHVLPNTLSFEKWGALTSKRRAGKRPRVGWAGAQQHAGDLGLIEDVVAATCHEVDWIFLGMCPPQMIKYAAEVHDFELSLENYPQRLAAMNLDLAVAPLEMHPFNEAKSNLRLLEYGALGWPVICTDIVPYQSNRPPVTRLPNEPKRWIAAIRERVADLDALAKEGDALKAWVWRNYRLDNYLDTWQAALLGTRKRR